MKEKSLKNVVSGLLKQLVTIILGIIIPRLILTNLGSESNGLITSISNILTYVALLEAGVGAASIQAMFKPIANDDKSKINGILSATAYFYKKTGIAYLSVILVLSFVFPFTITTSIPTYKVMLVVFLSGVPGVINYFFQGKYQVFLTAEGKSFIQTNLGIIIYIITACAKIVLLNLGFGIVSIQVLGVATNFIQVIYIEIYIHVNYKWLNSNLKPDFFEIKQSKNALIHQIAWLITSNTDTIVLTYFCGLKVVSVYAIYTYLFSSIDGIISSLTSGVHFALGQTFQADVNDYRIKHGTYEICILALCFSLFCIAGLFTESFLSLYTAGINDIQYCDLYLPWLFSAVHILVQGRNTSWETIAVAGDFKKTQHQSILEAIINIITSLILVYCLGIYGVLLGTVIASSYRLIAMIIYSRKKILGDSPWITIRRYVINIILIILIVFLARRLIKILVLNSYIKIILSAAIAGIIIIPIFFIVNILFERNQGRIMIDFLKKLYINKKKSS